MPERAPFLGTPYGAYHCPDDLEPDAGLTRVGRGTPGGEYLRRFWHPIAYSSEVQDLPLRVRVLGEDLVLFRDLSGRVGLLQWRCAHRGTSLEFGLPSERGLRCCYHGWLFDVDGRILETPNEPPESTLRERLCQGAYPARDYQGLVFAYLGPPEHRPEFPVFDTFVLPAHTLVAAHKRVMPCNWVQIKENSMDPVHTAFLHTRVTGTQFTPEFGELPEVEWRETPIGLISVGTRRQGALAWVRISDLILPNMHQVPPIWERGLEEKMFSRPTHINWAVPVDDTHTLRIGFVFRREEPGVDWDDFDRKIMFGQTDERPYAERQRVPGDYEAQVGQGPVAVHALEHLVSSDRGVLMFRKALRDGIRAVGEGRDPKGVVREPGRVLPTWAQDTVVRVPPAATPEADRRLLREIGARVAATRDSGLPEPSRGTAPR